MKVGYIPEHFSTPLSFAHEHNWLGNNVELLPVKEGLGRLIALLNSGEINIAIGLTEAFVADIANYEKKLGYNVVATYVESPLCWAVSTGSQRDDITDIKLLLGKRIGVSRIGSGLYVMSFVLGLQYNFPQPFFSSHPILSNFANLRDSVNKKTNVEESDTFMWEYFTLKRYYYSGEIKQIGEIYTPWPSWVVCAQANLVAEKIEMIHDFLAGLRRGIIYFNEHPEESVSHICENLDYTSDDARQWLTTVSFNSSIGLKVIDWERVVENTRKVLRLAGVLKEEDETLVTRRLERGIVDVAHQASYD